MDGGTLNPSMLMIIAVQESEHALPKCGRGRHKKKIKSATASKNMSELSQCNRVGVTPKEASRMGCSWTVWAGGISVFSSVFFIFHPSMWQRGSERSNHALLPSPTRNHF